MCEQGHHDDALRWQAGHNDRLMDVCASHERAVAAARSSNDGRGMAQETNETKTKTEIINFSFSPKPISCELFQN
jgi:hypothetical protein